MPNSNLHLLTLLIVCVSMSVCVCVCFPEYVRVCESAHHPVLARACG